MVKTVDLTGTEAEVSNLGGKNTAIYNKSDGVLYASASPNVTPNADGVIEVPAGGYRGLDDTNGVIYLLGTGKAELTGTDYPVNFKQPSQSESGGGGSTSDVTKAYVDAQDSTNLGAAKSYTDTAVNAVKADVSDNADSISSLQADVAATDTKADAAQAAAAQNATSIAALQIDMSDVQSAVNTAQTTAEAAQAAADANAANITASSSQIQTNTADISALETSKADKTEIPTTLPANGGNADTVNGHTVNANVPANAKFTDTIVDVSGKMDKNNPTGTGTFSLNRDEGSIIGEYSSTVGYSNTASGDYAFASGVNTDAEGAMSHTSGYLTFTDAAAQGQHVEGGYCTAQGQCSHAQGWATYAEHKYSFAAGSGTRTGRVLDTVLGNLNVAKSDSLLTIGHGSGGHTDLIDQNMTGSAYNDYAREGATLRNVFRVNVNGSVYGVGEFNSSGADYAEYIKPWFDDNPDNEDRRGYFVTVKNGLLYKAEPSDYIVGITSGNPSVIGNGDEDWLGRWQRDEFNELVYEDVEVEDYEEQVDENGNIVSVNVGSHIEKRTIEVPEYDPTQEYIERKDRPEWSCVGMIGVLPLRDDGTCVAGGFAKCGEGGIATAAETWDCHKTFFVIERINDHIISVEMR